MNTQQAQQLVDAGVNLSTEGDSEQYPTFILADEKYEVDIIRTQEIKGWDSATKVPNTTDYIREIINLRGTIVPVIDLCVRFEMGKVEYNETTVVIVLKVFDSNKKERIIGFVVNAVSDVYDVPTSELKPPPDFGKVVNMEFIRGMTTIDENMIILLDIDHLFDTAVVIEKTGAEQVENEAEHQICHLPVIREVQWILTTRLLITDNWQLFFIPIKQ